MPFEGGSFVLDLAGVVSTDAGAIGSVLNPEGAQVIITEVTLWVKTQPDTAVNLTVGIAADAVTEGTNLIGSVAIGAFTGKAHSGLAKTANVELPVWDADEYVNAKGSADSTGLVGKIMLKYRRV